MKPRLEILAARFSLLALMIGVGWHGHGVAGPPAEAAARDQKHVALAGKGQQEPPRYRFIVGQKFVYESTREAGPDAAVTERLHAWVVGDRAEGGWRLVLRKEPLKQNVIDEAKVLLAYLDIAPDGRVEPNPTLSLKMEPRTFFPKLPGPPAEMAAGWSEYDPIHDLSNAYTTLPDAGGIECTVSGEMIEGGSTTRRYEWDPERATVKRIVFPTGRTTVLKAVTAEPADSMDALGRDAASYFTALADYARRLDAATRMPTEEAATEAIAAAQQVFDGVVEGLRSAEIKPAAQKMLASLRTNAESICKPGGIRERTSRVIGKPLGDWEAVDLKGTRHTAADYRGKIVVADFWYRHCPYCILAMPQVKAIAARFRDHPVAVLGMNTDDDEADAAFMAEKVGMPWPTLRAKPLEPLFHMQDFGFPALFVIDQEGVVRTMRLGYSATLAEEMIDEIERLLAKGN